MEKVQITAKDENPMRADDFVLDILLELRKKHEVCGRNIREDVRRATRQNKHQWPYNWYYPGPTPQKSARSCTGPETEKLIQVGKENKLGAKIKDPTNSWWTRWVLIIPKKCGKLQMWANPPGIYTATTEVSYSMTCMKECIDCFENFKVF